MWTGSGGALMNTVTNLLVPQNTDIFLTGRATVSFSRGLSRIKSGKGCAVVLGIRCRLQP